MNTNDPLKDMREEREEQKNDAIAQLNKFKNNKITLERPVFFVPGWTDESCQCWTADEENKDSENCFTKKIIDQQNNQFIN